MDIEITESDREIKQVHKKHSQRNDYMGGKARDIDRRHKPFIGWDGEGFSLDGTHHYALFGSSAGLRIRGNLDWQSCLPLLFQSPKDAHHVIFAGTYDVVMMFRNAPRVDYLLKGFPIYLNEYRVQFLKGKFLKVTDRKLKESRILYDVFTFFGTSFVKACREYLGDLPILDEVQAMKEQRNLFTEAGILEDTGEVETYMSQELDLLVKLCTDLRAKLALVNIHPQYWHGPGAVASTILKMNHVKKHESNGAYNDEFRRHAEAAYYGGRFEQFQRGTFEGTVYQYDIRSAYPAAMRFLRSLDATVWDLRYGNSARDSFSEYGLYYVDWERSPEPISIGYLPYRHTNGNIYYPPYFAKGWYWGIEIPPLLQGHITKGYFPMVDEVTYPLEFVQEMYDQRAKLKAAKQPHQLALKLGLNSIYGKLAQSKGAKLNEAKEWIYPTFHEVVWSGWITAFTRRKISDALHSVPQKYIIATETDSVFSLVPLDLPVNGGLGAWECEELEGIKYIQSGVSLVKKGGEWHFKTRGFTVKRTQDEVALWSSFLESDNASMTIKQTRFSTDPRTETFGNWFETEHTLSLNESPIQKRVHAKGYCRACKDGRSLGACMHPMLVPKIEPRESTAYKFIWNLPLDEGDVFAQLLRENDPTFRLEYAS